MVKIDKKSRYGCVQSEHLLCVKFCPKIMRSYGSLGGGALKDHIGSQGGEVKMGQKRLHNFSNAP